jgi:hypothetical protein
VRRPTEAVLLEQEKEKEKKALRIRFGGLIDEACGSELSGEN